MQINGFVHDREGSTEFFDGRRMRPAEKWDEWKPSHEMRKTADGSWEITLPLSASGGHEKNGIYQCLFSANNNSDWGFSAILGKPGRLAGGNGYESRVGHIEETAIVFRVAADGNYTIRVWPEEFRFEISPTVKFFEVPATRLMAMSSPTRGTPRHRVTTWSAERTGSGTRISGWPPTAGRTGSTR